MNGMAEGFVPLVVSQDETVEAFAHSLYPFAGIMWHPERETDFSSFDIKFFRNAILSKM